MNRELLNKLRSEDKLRTESLLWKVDHFFLKIRTLIKDHTYDFSCKNKSKLWNKIFSQIYRENWLKNQENWNKLILKRLKIYLIIQQKNFIYIFNLEIRLTIRKFSKQLLIINILIYLLIFSWNYFFESKISYKKKYYSIFFIYF